MSRLVAFFNSRYAPIAAIALPLVASSVSDFIVGFVDAALLGRYSVEATAGVGAVLTVLFAFLVVIGVAGIGNSILVAQRISGKNFVKAGSAMRHATIITMFFVTVFTIAGIVWADYFAGLLSDDPAVIREGSKYLRIRSFGLPLIGIQFILRDVLAADRNTKWIFFESLIVNSVNVLASSLLIFGAGPFPELGVAGAAWGGNLGAIVGAIFLLYIFSSRGYFAKLKPHLLIFEKSEMIKMLKIGVPAIITVASLNIANIFTFDIYGRLGTVDQAAGSLLFSASELFFVIIFGFYEASQILASRALGAGRQLELKNIYRRSSEFVVVVMALLTLPFFIAPDLVFSIYTSFDDVKEIASRSSVLLGLMAFPMSWTMVTIAFVRGLGETAREMVASTLTVWLIRIPLSYVFGITLFGAGLNWGVQGVIFVEIVFWLARGIFNYIWLAKLLRKPTNLKAS